MQLDSGNSSSADLSHLDPAAEQLLAGKLHVADEGEDQEFHNGTSLCSLKEFVAWSLLLDGSMREMDLGKAERDLMSRGSH